ncbi:hypothetical protein B0J12DRAFT_113816 [Macrophomina phaseolina]|uniref:Transmembrane protein n=1 Tax=Macrophomina phaseolina TaxID=35725 RepID=A0ABQ8G8R6_9PEZI|nr:hypothetical protein B0J12DRAFT_113816 [Macrophomina phaseolina]
MKKEVMHGCVIWYDDECVTLCLGMIEGGMKGGAYGACCVGIVSFAAERCVALLLCSCCVFCVPWSDSCVLFLWLYHRFLSASSDLYGQLDMCVGYLLYTFSWLLVAFVTCTVFDSSP